MTYVNYQYFPMHGYIYLSHQTTPLLTEQGIRVEDVVVTQSSTVVFYLHKYVVFLSSNLRKPIKEFPLVNKLVLPKQVDQELIAAVQQRGKLVLLNPHCNEMKELMELPMLPQKTSMEWYFFNQYYIFQLSGMFTYREEGHGNSVGLATFKDNCKVSSLKHNIAVKGSSDKVHSSIDQFDNNCTLAIYEPNVKRPIFRVQLLTLPSTVVSETQIQLGEIFTSRTNIVVKLVKMVSDQLFVICLTSESQKHLLVFVNSTSLQIVYVIDSPKAFIRPLIDIRNNPVCFLYESAGTNPASFYIQALSSMEVPTVVTLQSCLTGDTHRDYGGKRIYKWWPSQGGVDLHTWTAYGKRSLYRHLMKTTGVETRFGDDMCRIAVRLLD